MKKIIILMIMLVLLSLGVLAQTAKDTDYNCGFFYVKSLEFGLISGYGCSIDSEDLGREAFIVNRTELITEVDIVSDLELSKYEEESKTDECLRRISIVEAMLNVTYEEPEVESSIKLYSCTARTITDQECLFGLSDVNDDGLRTRCYTGWDLIVDVPTGWTTCTTGWDLELVEVEK